MFRISDELFEKMREPERANWITSAATRLHVTYPDYYAALHVTPSDLEPLCKAVETWAAKHDVFGKRDVAQLCLLTPTLGHKFWRDPRFRGYIAESLGNAKLSRSRAAMMMTKNTESWLARLWQSDTLAYFSERLADSVRRDAEPTPEALQRILPGHWKQFSAAQNSQLLDWMLPNLPNAQIGSQRLAYAVCALVHGTDWLRDPQYGRIKQTIEQANRPQSLADGLAAIYAELSA